jgi:hypothetical protein
MRAKKNATNGYGGAVRLTIMFGLPNPVVEFATTGKSYAGAHGGASGQV